MTTARPVHAHAQNAAMNMSGRWMGDQNAAKPIRQSDHGAWPAKNTSSVTGNEALMRPLRHVDGTTANDRISANGTNANPTMLLATNGALTLPIVTSEIVQPSTTVTNSGRRKATHAPRPCGCVNNQANVSRGRSITRMSTLMGCADYRGETAVKLNQKVRAGSGRGCITGRFRGASSCRETACRSRSACSAYRV